MTQLIFGGLAVIAGIILFIVFSVASRDHNSDIPGGLKHIGSGLGLVGIVLLFTSYITVVPAGHRGIVAMFGKVDEKVLPEGLSLVNPICSIQHMSARVEKDAEKQVAETSDTQSVVVTVVTNWKPDAEKLAILYRDYGNEYANKIIPPAVQEAVKSEVAKYKVTELIARRPELHTGIQQKVNTWLHKYNLEVLEIAIADIDFSDTYDKAIEAKQVQEQQALQKNYELQRVETEAKMAAAEAKGKADSAIAAAEGQAQSVTINAKAEAESLRIRGEAQAHYNKMLAESMTPMLVQYQYTQKWNGVLPTMMMGEGTTTTLMLPIQK